MWCCPAAAWVRIYPSAPVSASSSNTWSPQRNTGCTRTSPCLNSHCATSSSTSRLSGGQYCREWSTSTHKYGKVTVTFVRADMIWGSDTSRLTSWRNSKMTEPRCCTFTSRSVMSAVSFFRLSTRSVRFGSMSMMVVVNRKCVCFIHRWEMTTCSSPPQRSAMGWLYSSAVWK